MQFKLYGQNYINWVLHLGRFNSVLLGFFILATFAILIQGGLSLLFTGKIELADIFRSIIFGLFSAPFVLYFFILIVEKLEHSRRKLEVSIQELSHLREQDIRLNMELEQKADFLNSFFDTSPDLIFYRDANGLYLECNHAMEILTGKPKKEIIQALPDEIFATETASLMLATDRETLEKQAMVSYEQWIQQQDGTLACFEIRKIPYYDRALNRDCIMGFGRDITERKRYQETIEQNSRDKTKLMATISHELRTPLNGIIGLSRILLDEELLPQQREYLKTINMSAVSLGYIFSDIIDLEKIDSRRIELNPQPVEFSQIISDISLFARLMAEQKHIQFSIDCAENLPDFIEVDNARLSQILWNLVNNAVKFTPEKGKISLSIQKQGENCYAFRLKDTGIGIAPADQSKIFSMFYQAESDHKAKGSGIGLAVSYHIAKLMGGDIQVESELNCGSTFTLTIQAKTTQQDQPLLIQSHALKVLLVEDIEVNVVVARAMLEKFGCAVDVAMTGADAKAKFAEQSYDLILLDIQLPDTTGFELAQSWREQYEQGEIDYLPLLVALTANVMQSKQQYQAMGMDDVLRKPLSLTALAQCLNDYFGQDIAPLSAPKAEKVPTSIVLNTELLDELLQVLGKKALLANVALFEQLMPDYLAQLNQALQQWQQKPTATHQQGLHNIAHKIKGAVAAIGLHQLQQIAQLAQTDDASNWQTNIALWVTQLNQLWRTDLQAVRQWINDY